MLGERHVMPSVKFSLKELLVEGTFPSGTFLVAVDDPISTLEGDLEKALYGSFLPVPSQDKFPELDATLYEPENQPGAVITPDKTILIHEGKKRKNLWIKNNGDRPVQVETSFPLPHKVVFLIRLKDWITLPPHRIKS